MKLTTDGDTVGFETGEGDAQLAESAAELFRTTYTAADRLGLLPEDHTGDCQECGTHAVLRPVATQNTETGQVGALHVCRECQTEFVDGKLEALAQRQLQEQAAADHDRRAAADPLEDAARAAEGPAGADA